MYKYKKIDWSLNICLSAPLGEEHNSEGAAHSPGGQVVGEACEDGAGVAVSGGNTTPDGPEPFVLLAGLGLVDIDNPLSEVVLSCGSIIDALKPEDALVGVLLHL